MADDDQRLRSIADDVETYLARHPEAVDSVEGIVRWWLPRLRLEEAVADVERALDLLVERGVVIKRQLPDGRCVYGSSAERGG
jgi:hypothetical protein